MAGSLFLDGYKRPKKDKDKEKDKTATTKSQSSSSSKPKTETVKNVNKTASKSTFMGGGTAVKNVQKNVSEPKKTTVKKNPQEAAQNVIQRSSKSTAMGGGTPHKVQTSAEKRAEKEKRNANRDANLYLKQTKLKTSKEQRQERAAKAETRRAIGQAQKSGDFEKASQLRGESKPGSIRAKYEQWDKDLADTMVHTVKQGLAADARVANIGMKGITQKDAFLYTTEEQRKKADEKVAARDKKLGKIIDDETTVMQKIQDKHSYLGKQALSAVSSTTGMAMDIAAGAIIPGSSLFHMWTRSTGTAMGEVNKKAENLRKQLKDSGQYTDDELDEMFRNVNALDLANAGASGGIEVLSELLFPGMGAARKVIGGKGMSIAERAGAKLFNKVGARATGGLLKNLTKGTLEEVAEEEVGGPLQALASNLIYGNKFQSYNEDAIKRSLSAESNALRSNIHSEADAQAAAARLSSKSFMDESIKSYMQSGYSKAEATKLAELSREYLTASLSGDVDTMKKYQDDMVNIMAGGVNSQKQKFGLQDAIDAAVSTSMMTMVTGAPVALSTMQAGNAYKENKGLDAVKQQAEMIKNWSSDPKDKAKAQAVIDHINNGGDLTGTQVYEIVQKSGEMAQERQKPEQIKNRVAHVEMTKRDLRISPINPDGTLAPQTQQRFEQIVTDTVNRHETLARLSSENKTEKDTSKERRTKGLTEDASEVENTRPAIERRTRFADRETGPDYNSVDVLKGANIGAAFEVGAINAEMVNELARGSETVKEVFQEVTGIDVHQFSTYNEMNDSLMAAAADNMVNSARIEQIAWNDESRKQVSDYVRSGIKSSQGKSLDIPKGDTAIQNVLESVDPRDRTQFLMTADVAGNMYDFARHTEGSWNEARQQFKQMYPSVDINTLKQVFDSAKEDKQIAETKGYGKVVTSGKPLDRSSLANAETAVVPGRFTDQRVNKEGATLTEESLAKNIVDGFGLNVILTDQAEVRDEKGNLLVNLGSVVKDKDGNVVLDEEGNPVMSVDNGAFLNDSNTLVIYAGADATRTVTQTAVHELTHHIAVHAPDEYVKLSKYIMDAWYRKDPEGFTRAIKARQALYKERRNQVLSDEQALEEIIADGAADFNWADEDFIADVTTKEPTLASKIIDAIKDVLQKIRNILASGNLIDDRAREALYDKAVELDTVQAMWLKAAQTARKAQADQAVDEWQDEANKLYSKAYDEAQGRFSIEEAEEKLEENFDEYKEDKENLRIAAEALSDLQDVRYSVEENTSDISGRWGRNVQVRTIGKGITADLVNEGYIEFRGRKVKNPEDLAKLCQVLRDPRFETFRVVLTKGDKIVSFRSISSRLPGLSQAFESADLSDGIDIVRDRMKRTGADGYYLIHNHPSGNVTASLADLSVTRAYLALLGQDTYKGHIILDHDKYGFIDADVPQVIRGENFPTAREESITGQQTFDLIHEPEIDHPLLGEAIHGHNDVAKCGQFVNASDDVSVLIYTNSPGEVTGIQEISNKTLKGNKEIAGFIKNQAVEFGAAGAFLYTTDIETYQASKDLVKSGHLVDSVVAYGNNRQWSESAREVVSPRADVEVLGQVHDDVIRRTHVFESATGVTEYRYSLPETDNEGKALTQDQREFFRDVAPELKDENGNLKRFYHGTGRADRVGYYFDPERANSGPMAYFTDNKDIATNYSQSKQDTSLAYESDDIHNYHNQFVVDVDGEEIRLEDYWHMLPASKRNEFKERAGHITRDWDTYELTYDENVTNGNGGYGNDPYLVRKARGNAFTMLIDAWLDSGDFFGEEEKFLEVMDLLGMEGVKYKDPYYREEKVYEVYLNVTNPLVTSDIDEEFVDDVRDWVDATDLDFYAKESAQADMWDKNSVDPYDWIERLESDVENDTTHAWTSIPDVITDFLKEQGYDGIVDKGGKGGGIGHQVVIPFSSEQIKDINNEHPTKENPDIRYSITPEMDDAYMDAVNSNDMDEAQRLVDEAAKMAGYNTPKLYHGTPSFGFTEFDLSKGEMIIFATNSRLTAETYSGETERNKLSDKSNIDVDSLSGDALLNEASKYRGKYSDYQLMTPAEQERMLDESREEVKLFAQDAASFIEENKDSFDEEKLAIANRIVDSINRISNAWAEDMVDAAWNDFEDAMWDLKWMDESIQLELTQALQEGGSLLYWKNKISDMMYSGDIYRNKSYENEYIFDNQLALELEADLGKGIYGLYANPGRQLVIEANGSNWNQINPPEELNLYGPQRTRSIAEAAKAKGYDSVLFRELRDNGGATAYNGDSDVYMFFNPSQVKSADTVTYAEDGSVIPLSERFDPNNNDIRYSMPTTDADGEILTDGQMEYFKNSQARDIFGRLVPVYHATDEGGFTIFDPWKSDDHRSLFFTNKRDVANTYVEDKYLSDENRIGSDDNTEERSGYYQVYLNLENPLIIEGHGQPWNNIVDGGSVFPAYSSITLRNRSWFEEEAEGRDEMYDRGQSLYNGDNARARAQEFEGDDYVEIEIFNGKKKIKAIIPLTEEAVAEEAAAAFGVDDLELLQGVASEIVGDMEFGNITKIYDDDMRNTIGEYGYNTREWAEFAEDEGHDGVIFRNIIDIDDKTEMFDSEEEAASDVYVAFSSNQVKDINNENPSENPDIRYSVTPEDESMSRIAYEDAMDDSYELLAYYEQQLGIVNPETFDVTKAFKEEDVVKFLDALKAEDAVPSADAKFEEDRVRRAKSKAEFYSSVNAKWNDRWITEGEVLNIASVKRDITNLVKGTMANSNSDAQYRNEIVKKTLIDARTAYQLMKQDRTELASYLLYHSAQRMIDGLEFIRDDTAFKEYKEIRDYLRTYRINAPEEYWENEKFLDFRKEYYGRLRIGKGISNIEDVYQDCQDRWPHLFNEAEREKADNLGDSPEDLLLHIGVVVDSNVTPFMEAYSSEEAASLAYDLADQLYEIIANGDREVSLADTYKERFDAQTKAMKQRHYEAILRERKIREEGIQKEREKFRAYKERQRERQAELEEKIADLRVTQGRKLKTQKAKADFEIATLKQNREYNIQRLKAEKARAVKEERQKARWKEEERRERIIHNKYFKSIQKTHKKLTERLLTNTKDSHIPEQYKRELARLLSVFDLQTMASKEREVHKGADGYTRIDVSQSTLKMAAMKTVLEQIEERSEMFRLNDAITDIMDDLLKVDGKTIDAMTVSDLKNLDSLMKALLHEFNNYEKVRVGVKKQQAADIGHAQNDISLGHADQFGPGRDYQNTPGWVDKILNLDEMTAAYLFKRIDPNKEGLGLMYGEIRKSFDKYVRNQNQLNDWMEEIVGKYHNKGILWNKYGSGELTNWRSDNYAQTFNLEHGPLRLTIAQMMSVACLANRQQARDHMLGAGVVVAPVSFNAKMLSDLKKKVNKAVPLKLTDADIETIVTALTPEQRQVANKLQELMATKMAEWGNEASMNVLGIKLFEDPDYFPIRSDRAGLTKDLDPNQFEQAIRNFGFTKAVQPGARNAIMIDDIFDVVTEHCNNMNLYNSYTEAMNDFMKVYNYREVREDGEYTVEQALRHAFSDKTPTFIMQFMRDLNGNVSRRASGIEDAYNSLLGNAKKASVFANLRVAAQQPTAITRAFAVINPKYIKGIKIEKGAMTEMFEHCPIALWKSWGYYDINMGKSIEDIMMNNGRWLEDKATDLYGALDNVTWTAIWQMVKAEMKDTHPNVKEGTDEYWELCNERMSEIVDLTQVVDSPMHRSHAMRDKGFLKKTATAFMAEPTLTFNMIRDGWVSAREAWKSGDKAKATKIANKTIAVTLLQAAAVGGMAAIVDALRKKKPDKDDDDDRFLHLWWVNALENFENEINLFNKIYFVKDIASIFEGWENSNLALQGIQKFALGFRQWNGDPYARSSAEWYENMADGIGYMWGIPVKTIRTGLANAMNNLGLASPFLESVGENLDNMARDPKEDASEKSAFIGSLLSDEDPKGMFGKLLTLKKEDAAPKTAAASMSEDDLPDNLTDEQKEEILKAGEKRAEKNAEKGTANGETDYDELVYKAMKSAAGLEGEEYNKKVYSVIANGLKDYAQNANYYELSKMRDAIETAGGDVNYFDQQVVKNSKTAFKKTIKADMTPDEVNKQALLYHYLVTHGVSQEEISSEIVYKSEIAKDMKVAFRIGDEDTINEALEPLAQAGILQEDLDRLWTNRNRIDLAKYKENGGRYADRLKSMGTFVWPVNGTITSHFGYRNAPTAGASSNHPAIDIGVPVGTPVAAADGGVVIYAGRNSGYGNSVGIKHDNGMVTYYNHLDSWNVNVGDTVAQGQQIACSGNTGISTGPHLDFKILDANGDPVDPEKYLN